ncbi:UNVERIFIED_CONTAM: hypothetical protein NCL1_11981 [Trichonephila clavipes]
MGSLMSILAGKANSFIAETAFSAEALERIGGIPINAVQVYTDGSRDDYYRSGSEIYMKSQDHILRIQRRNPDGCSVFRSELIAIDEALGSLASLPTGKEIWTLSDSREQYSTCPISKA